MNGPHILVNMADPRRGVLDATVHPKPGAESHHIGYLRGDKPPWFCTCPKGARCPWIRQVRTHPDTPDMEGK